MELYHFLKGLLWPIKRGFNLRIVGQCKIPKKGPALLAWNHSAEADSVLAPIVIDRRIIFLGKKELLKGKYGWIVKKLDTIIVDRNSGRSHEVVDSAARMLEKGHLVGVFPEGTTIGGPKLRRFRTGIARIAVQANVPIYPIALLRKRRGKKVIWRDTISVVGDPIRPPKRKTWTKADFQAVSDQIQDSIKDSILKHNQRHEYDHLLP